MVNPGRRKRKLRNPKKLTLKQKLFFGTPAQRAAAKKALKSGGKAKKRRKVANPGGRKRVTRKRRAVKATTKRRSAKRTGGYRKRVRNAGVRKTRTVKRKSTVKRRRKRIANVGQIITFGLAGNPGKKRKTRKRGVSMAKRRRVRRTRRPATRRRRRVGNPSLMKMFSRRKRSRRNPGRRRRYANKGRRRNPGMLSGIGSQVGGIIGGAALTKFIVDKLVPVQYATGITGYAVNGLIAYLQGYLVARFVGKPGLGAAMQIGGYTQLALRILNDFAPGLSSYSALGLRGALAQSSFYTPQIAKPNSYTQFVTPNATLRALPPPSMKGVRGGRVN